MSRWTHIRGGFELTATPYEYKGKKDIHYGSKDAYLPFPDEQLEISAPRPRIYEEKKGGRLQSGLYFKARVYSLPRARGIIKEAFNLLPQGESGLDYFLKQDYRNCHSGSSDFNYPCEEKIFKKKIVDLFSKDKSYPYTYKEYKDLYGIECYSVDMVDGIIVGIRDDIRDCSGQELLEGLEKFFTYLDERQVFIEDGYLEWEDEYESDIIYSWRCSRLDSDLTRMYAFHKLDKKTNKILWTRTYRLHMLPDAKNEWDYDLDKRPLLVEDETFEG